MAACTEDATFRKSTISPFRIPSLGLEDIPTMLRLSFSPTSPTNALAWEVPISTDPIILLILLLNWGLLY